MNELINNKADCRTSPATTGLLNMPKTKIAWNGLQSLTNTACSNKGEQVINHTFL